MNVEDKKRLLRSAEFRAIRALRLALTALFDAWPDIVANFAGDPGDEPEEIEQARVRAWNSIRPLLIEAARDIETFAKSGMLGAHYTARTIELCESTLKVMKQDDEAERTAKRLEPYLEKLRADPDNQILLLQARLSGLHTEVEEKRPWAEGPAEGESER
jgi:hypothetical protein